MALTLKAAITAGQTTFDVEGTDSLREGSYRTIESETVLIRTARVQGLQPGETAWQRLSVDRGIENTEAVAHDAAVTMATYSAAGGGGVTVDNGVDAPAEVTTIVASGAVIAGATATLGMQFATRVLTNAEIKALGSVVDPSDYPTLVADPGVGKMLFYINGFLLLDATAGAYGGLNFAYLWIGQDGLSFGDVSNGALLLEQGAVKRYAPVGGPKQFGFEFVEPSTEWSAIPGRLWLGGGLGTANAAYTGGHADNTLTVGVAYVVIDL